jgi:hypothetical protein
MEFHNTGESGSCSGRITSELLHDGDLFAMVSSGPSSIAIDMTYDRKRLDDEAIGRISGAGLMPDEIVATPGGSQGPPEVRYRAHVAFSTVYEVLQKMELGPQPPQGLHLRERRIRLRSLREVARPGGERAVRVVHRSGPRHQSVLEGRQRVRRRRPRGRSCPS